MDGYKKSLLVTLAHALATSMVVVILAPYFSEQGYSESWISFVFGIFSFILIAVSAFFGDLSDQVGRYRIIVFGLIGTIIAFGLYFLASPWSIIAGRILDAVCFGAVTVLLLSKMEDSVEDSSRGRKTGLALSLNYCVRLLAPVVSGILADIYLGLPFFVSMSILFILVISLRKAKLRKTSGVTPHPIKQIKWLFSQKNLRPLLLLGPAMHARDPAFVVFIPLFIRNTLQLSYADVGLAIGIFGAGHISQVLFGELSDRYGSRKFIIAGTIIKSALLVAIGFVTSFTQLLVVLFFLGIGSAMWNVCAWSYISSIAERAKKEGAVVGSYLSVSKIGSALAFPLAGFLVATGSYQLVFIVLGAIGVVASLLAGVMFFHQRSSFAKNA